MYNRYNSHARRIATDVRGSDVLQTLPEEKIIWNPKGFNFTSLRTKASLLRFCLRNPWTKMGNAVLGQMGIAVPKLPRNALLVEYGSSNNLAWVREDLKVLKVVSLMPNGVGIITLARGNGSLQESLDTMARSYLAIGMQGYKALASLESLFSQETLWQAPSKAPLPKKERLIEAYANLGITKSLAVIAAVCDEVARSRGGWADFVAVYRYVVAQLINMNFGLKVPLAAVSLEDLLMQNTKLGQVSVSEYLSMLRQSLGGDFWWVRDVRALNHPCPYCKDWHFASSKGHFQKGRGESVKKKCRLKRAGQTKLAEVLREGAGLSGTGIYMAFGELGKGNVFYALARDYSKGKVFEVLESYLKDKQNGLRFIPVGSLYLYAGGGEPGVSVDSLVFWEFLARLGGDAGEAFTQIWEALPVPFTKRGEGTHITLCLDGRVKVTKH